MNPTELISDNWSMWHVVRSAGMAASVATIFPGYEAAKPIGTPLANWGRKDPSQLAFENINEFLSAHGEHMPTRDRGAKQPVRLQCTVKTRPAGASGGGVHSRARRGRATKSSQGFNPLDDKFDSDTGYFLQSLSQP